MIRLEWKPAAAAVAAVAGVILGRVLGAGFGVWPFSGACCIVAGAFVGSRSHGQSSSMARNAAIAASVGLLVTAATQRSLNGLAHHALQHSTAARAAVEIEGELVGDPVPGQFATTVLVRVDRARIRRGPWLRVDRVLLSHATKGNASALDALASGDHLRVLGDLAELRGFDTRSRWRHAVARLDIFAITAIDEPPSRLMRGANWLRAVVQRGTQSLPERERALLDGFLLGDTRSIDTATVQQFRAAGLSHLLAVSGANVAFVLALAAPLTRRGRIGLRLAFGIVIVIGFAAMTRFEPSVLRASVMAAVVMLAQFSGRRVSAVRALSYSVVALLLVDPLLLMQVGFQLSVGACIGIVLFSAPLARRVPGPRAIRNALSVSLAAQLGVAPVLYATFGSLPWVAPAANLLAVPVAEPITVIGLPVAALGAWWAPLRLLLVPVQWLLQWVEAVARVSTDTPWLILVLGSLVVVLGAVLAPNPGPRAPIDSPT